MNDPRLAGRWWSTDPITKPWESPYAGYGNNPVSFIDPMGLSQTDPNNNPDISKPTELGQSLEYESSNFISRKDKDGNLVWGYGVSPSGATEGEKPTWLQRTGDFLAGSGFGALDWIGSKIVAPLDFLMNWNEPSYRQGLDNNFNGAVTIVKAAGGDPIAQTQVATGVKQAAENWWNASDFDKGKPFGGVAMDIAVPWGIRKLGLPRAATAEVVISKETAGIVGTSLRSVDDVIANPSLLEGRSLSEVKEILKDTPGWEEGQMKRTRSADKGWTLYQLNPRGTDPTDLYIQFHPGTHRHFNGKPYWKVSSGKKGVQHYKASE